MAFFAAIDRSTPGIRPENELKLRRILIDVRSPTCIVEEIVFCTTDRANYLDGDGGDSKDRQGDGQRDSEDNPLGSMGKLHVASDHYDLVCWTPRLCEKLPCSCRAMSEDFSAALLSQRQAARQTLQSCIDQWIDSGKRSDGKENAMQRSEEPCPDTVEQATIFWRSSQFEWLPDGVGRRAIPPKDTFDSAIRKARRCIAGVLDNPDLRHRIAKCRFDRCRRPYFLLKNPAKKVYKHGLFCRPQHNNRAASARDSQRYRRKLNDKRVEKAAGFVLSRKLPWTWNHDFKRKVIKYLGNREAAMAHCAKCAEHHDALAKCHRRMAKSHSQIADANKDPTLAEHHRDLSKPRGTIAESHDEMREHFENRREALANGSGADVIDSHESAGDSLMHSAAANLLDVDGRIDYRKFIAAEL
jgi:hypothetical protein